MASFTEQIKLLIKENGGTIKTRKAVNEWYKITMDNDALTSVVPNDKYMFPGKFYVFNYDPKLKDSLSYYDRNPVVFSLGLKTGPDYTLDFGININFIPLKIKLEMFDRIYKDYGFILDTQIKKYPNLAEFQRELRINYEIIKKMLDDLKVGFALRSYYIDRRSNTRIVSYDHWDKMMLLDVQDLEGVTVNQIISKYYSQYKPKKGKFNRVF